ncbi:hypothetical protein B0H12DRAFT_1246059 [Mycena haematopus]|nr:hypothetical protein B0H12DRAFT_1246059 [Mycena haematopus]
MPKESKPRKSKAVTAPATALRQKKATLQDEFGKALKTKKAYKGYYTRGVAIIDDVVADRKRQEAENPGCLANDGIDTELLAKAFSGPPNKHSVYALELYLTQKCVVEGHGQPTAEGIHGAMADYWERLPGGKYTGTYSYDEETGKVSSNPARAPVISSGYAHL